MPKQAIKIVALAALAASQLAVAPAQAQVLAGASGVPLGANENCALQFFNRQGNGPLIAKVPGRMSGRYELVVERPGADGGDEIEASGSFSASGSREQVIASLHLGFHQFSHSRGDLFAAPSRPLPTSTPAPSGELRIYNARGRMVCRDAGVAVYDYLRWNDAGALVQSGRPGLPSRPPARPSRPVSSPALALPRTRY